MIKLIPYLLWQVLKLLTVLLFKEVFQLIYDFGTIGEIQAKHGQETNLSVFFAVSYRSKQRS